MPDTLEQPRGQYEAVIIISANAEWRAIKSLVPGRSMSQSPHGEYFLEKAGPTEDGCSVFFHGGWGKISAAASTQYCIDQWNPRFIVNLGTCGGFRGEIERETVVIPTKTVVYDIVEQMGDAQEAIEHYTTHLDTAWLPEGLPFKTLKSVLVSADRDIIATEIPELRRRYGAVAADWESGAIAYVARKNNVPCVIFRGVTDLVDEKDGGEAYANIAVFQDACRGILKKLTESLAYILPAVPQAWRRKP
jgi:adenosylhomocysteine nucleosidase